MCNLNLAKEKKFFGAIDVKVAHGFSGYFLGYGMCEAYHFCRFGVSNGKRYLRSPVVFMSLGLALSILAAVWMPLIVLWLSFVYAAIASYNILVSHIFKRTG